MTDNKLLHAVNIADAAMMTVVKALYQRGDERAKKLTNLQSDFCCDLQQELGSTGETVSCATVGAAVEMLEALEAVRGLDASLFPQEIQGQVVAAINKAHGGS